MNFHAEERLNFRINLQMGLHTLQGKTQLVDFVARSLGINNSFHKLEDAMNAIFAIRPDLDGLRGIRDLAISLGYSFK